MCGDEPGEGDELEDSEQDPDRREADFEGSYCVAALDSC